MINLSAENKALCFADSTAKPLSLYMYQWVEDESTMDGGYWKHFTTIKDGIILESAEFEEGVLDSKRFELGSFVVPTLKVKWRNEHIRYKNFVCVPVQQIGNQMIAYMYGYVREESLSEDGSTVTGKIVPYIYDSINGKVKSYLDIDEFINQPLSFILWAVLNSVFANVDIDKLNANFQNATATIPSMADLEDSTTIADLIRQVGEFIGGQALIKTKRIVAEDELSRIDFIPPDEIEFIRLSNLNGIADNDIYPLPNEYERLEYLQSTGTQFIDTGHYPTNNTKVEIKQAFIYSQNPSSSYVSMGTAGGNNSRAEIGYLPSNQVFWSNCNGETSRFNDLIYPTELPHIFEWSGDGYFAVDKKVSHSKGSVATAFNSPTTFYLFKDNERMDNWCPIKTYYCKMWENDALIRHFVPCVRKADRQVGMFELVNGDFYVNNGTSDFIGGGKVSSFALPYYINLIYDKTDSIEYNSVSLKTESGNQKYYESDFRNPHSNQLKKQYSITDNYFFEKVAENQRQKLLDDVAQYVCGLDFFNCDLSGIYPPFVEGGDYVICRSKSSRFLPRGYSALEYIDAKEMFNTEIYPNAKDAKIKIDFALTNSDAQLFICGFGNKEEPYLDDTMQMYYEEDKRTLVGKFGYYGGSNQEPIFQITDVLPSQRANIEIKIEGYKVSYSGFYNGQGQSMTREMGQLPQPLYVGDNGNGYNLYKFEYYEGSQQLLDLYPCRRDNDGAVGLWDNVSHKFISNSGTVNLDFETSDIIVPVLALSARGIHSMRADITCQATEN